MSLTWILILSTLAMLGVMLLCNRYYHVPVYKLVICAAMLTVTGMIGGALLYYIENGQWGNQSFYGAILFAPPMMVLVALLLRAPVDAILDMVPTVGCLFLAVQKIQCIRVGCCEGKLMGYDAQGNEVLFPSQLLEGAVALLIGIFLFWLISEKKNRGRILAWFLVLYGATRFVLNLTRETTPFLFGLAAGNVWSVVAVLEGILLFIFLRPKKGE